jgi:hypothetical protein
MFNTLEKFQFGLAQMYRNWLTIDAAKMVGLLGSETMFASEVSDEATACVLKVEIYNWKFHSQNHFICTWTKLLKLWKRRQMAQPKNLDDVKTQKTICQILVNAPGISSALSHSRTDSILRNIRINTERNQPQWPRNRRRGSAAVRLLRLWVRIPLRHWYLSLVGVVCCQVEVRASGWSLVQRNPTECGVFECDREASIMRRPWPTGGCCTMEKEILKANFWIYDRTPWMFNDPS